jgi:hypothetical protein
MAFTEFKKAMLRTARTLKLRPGDIYEDCSYHPVLCLGADYKTDEVWGVSLIDGTYPRSCSLRFCGVRKLTPKQAWEIKACGPLDLEVREQFPTASRWWTRDSQREHATWPVRLVGPQRIAPSLAKRVATRKANTKSGGTDA